VNTSDIALEELANGLTFNARAFANTVFPGRSYGALYEDQYNGRFAMSYVTGSHNFKTGLFWMYATTDHETNTNGDVLYTLLNGVPSSITQFATPGVNGARGVNTALYAQDQWKPTQQLTLNLGVRLDYLRGWSPEMDAPAGRWVPARHYPRTDDLPNFKDLSPRLGFAYDLFDNSKTAVKASLGRYVSIGSTALAAANSPSQTEVFATTRTWNDANGDWEPQAGELGPLSNAAFGTQLIRTRLADEVRKGFGNREYNWQASAVIEHELRPGFAFDVGYFRTWYGNLTVTDNVAVTPADFQEFCVTGPVDSRLADASGARICGLYDVVPSKFGQVNNLITQVDKSEVYNGVDVNVRGRFPNGAQLAGGASTGQTVIDNCSAAVDSPEALRFCRQTLPFAGQTNFRVYGVYPLPADFSVSATFQDLPGIDISADQVLTNAVIAPSLGRDLAAGARATRTVQLIEPFAMREDRRRQLDVRLSRAFRVAGARVLGTFEVFNALNANSVLRLTTRYGAAWLRPNEIVVGRLLKVGTQITF
jgi:outer membrane receptor protein involved in Fe transport